MKTLALGPTAFTSSGIWASWPLIFHSLYAYISGINPGLIFNLTMDEIIEIGIKVCCLSVGSFFIIYF